MSQEQPVHSKRLFVNRGVHVVLLTGVVVSGTVMVIGLTLVFSRHVARPETVAVSMTAEARRAMQGDPVAMLYAGLAILILTPVARVAILALGWLLAGDRRFALVALTVLTLLCLSLWLGTG